MYELTVVVAGASMTLYIPWFALATLVAGSLSASVYDNRQSLFASVDAGSLSASVNDNRMSLFASVPAQGGFEDQSDECYNEKNDCANGIFCQVEARPNWRVMCAMMVCGSC